MSGGRPSRDEQCDFVSEDDGRKRKCQKRKGHAQRVDKAGRHLAEDEFHTGGYRDLEDYVRRQIKVMDDVI